MKLSEWPLMTALRGSKKVLLAGMGGGFDVYCAIPLMVMLESQGIDTVLANLSFTALEATTAERIDEASWRVTADSDGPAYFRSDL